MNSREERHNTAVARVAEQLRAKGHAVRVVSTHSHSGGIDLVCDGTRIAVRVASETPCRWIVRNHGRRYEYDRTRWVWNLHCHARRSAESADVVVLVALDGNTSARFVLPREHVPGKTAQTWIRRTDGAWGGRLAEWREKWGVIDEVQRSVEAA